MNVAHNKRKYIIQENVGGKWELVRSQYQTQNLNGTFNYRDVKRITKHNNVSIFNNVGDSATEGDYHITLWSGDLTFNRNIYNNPPTLLTKQEIADKKAAELKKAQALVNQNKIDAAQAAIDAQAIKVKKQQERRNVTRINESIGTLDNLKNRIPAQFDVEWGNLFAGDPKDKIFIVERYTRTGNVIVKSKNSKGKGHTFKSVLEATKVSANKIVNFNNNDFTKIGDSYEGNGYRVTLWDNKLLRFV
jgi:hypothetical protein